MQNASEAVQNPIQNEGSDMGSMLNGYENIRNNPLDSYKQYVRLCDSPEMEDIALRMKKHLEECGIDTNEKIGFLDEFNDVPLEVTLQKLIELHGVGPTKFSQILSNMTDLMDAIGEKSPELRIAMERTRSDCSFSRTIEEAQAIVNASFPDKNYVLIKPMSAASMGETYKVKRPDGSIGVLKLLKKGIDATQLEIEKDYYTLLIQEFNTNPESAQKQIAKIQQCYEDWKDELDFSGEVAANKKLANGAKRYRVAAVTDVSPDNKCLIMDFAEGVKMKDLMDMLIFYKENPSEYFTKYASDIEENPFLGNPEKVIQELPKSLLKAFDEQFMFIKSGGTSLMHGDPHMGNYFITTDAKGNLIPEFIDTGLCIERTTTQIQSDIKFFTNYFVGNSKEIATYYVDQCNVPTTQRESIIESLSEEIHNEIFNKHKNIIDFATVQSKITQMLDDRGLSIDPTTTTALKAEMQFFTGISDIGKLSGQKLNIPTILADVPQASWSMIKHGVNPWSTLAPALKFLYYNQEQAVSTAYQFKIQ